MKRLRPLFKKWEGIFLEEIPTSELDEVKDLTEFLVNYYEMVVIERRVPLSVREALDCVDFVILHEREPRCYEYWPRMAELYKRSMDHLRTHTSIWEDPVLGQGYYAEKEIKPRYDFKLQILRGFAESKGYVVT